jgi:hypothetical protein
MTMNARFNRLDPEASYLIIDGATGHSKGDGMQGAEATLNLVANLTEQPQ